MLKQDIIEAIQQHALACYPEESCGFIFPDRYAPQRNVSPTPAQHFRISRQAMTEARAEHIVAIAHSHPDGNHFPSLMDMQGQISTGVPWYICNIDQGRVTDFFGWGKPGMTPLTGRPFRHGVTDCYAIIRDYFFRHRRVTLNDYPRSWEWWKSGEDLYEKYFRQEGFSVIESSEVEAGDVFLAAIASRQINHGGVYTGNGLILHQLGNQHGYAPDRLSCRTPVTPWLKHIKYWIRYDG
ncbi:C40 family peptidase [Vibrio quintilis]|uniref:NlpC/P60 family protein n=1 Tax=Vibrio quintilis TaxID=1117707 RepID=A0A1M7YZ53_9VIBR|nr:C40 family peptidase [Vibrio quintilis]SHO57832.1 NlpC/P60 family protein [Vibrio quintilis]